MHVQSFELVGAEQADLRALHDYLMAVGSFEFPAGGAGFFTMVGERFLPSIAARVTQTVIATFESDVLAVDVVLSGGIEDEDSQFAEQALRLVSLLRGFADRKNMTLNAI